MENEKGPWNISKEFAAEIDPIREENEAVKNELLSIKTSLQEKFPNTPQTNIRVGFVEEEPLIYAHIFTQEHFNGVVTTAEMLVDSANKTLREMYYQKKLFLDVSSVDQMIEVIVIER